MFFQNTKTFTFDRVFGPATTQEQVYIAGAQPIVKGVKFTFLLSNKF